MSVFFNSIKWVFAKGVNSCFRSKKPIILSSLFFSKIGLETILSYGLERKKAFEDNKNVNFLNGKKWVFAEGVHPWFCSNNPRFFLVCFSAK